MGGGINWEGSRIIEKENARGSGDDQKEGDGKKVLNICNQMEQWKSTIYSFLKK